MARRARFGWREKGSTRELRDQVLRLAHPLGDSEDLDPLLDRIGDAHYVLLGEASHGTAEYYTWRMKLSQRLIEEKAFSFIGVEGDWPDCYRVNRYVKGYADAGENAHEVLSSFGRWPTRSEEHTSELQSPDHLVCRLLLEKKNKEKKLTTQKKKKYELKK